MDKLINLKRARKRRDREQDAKRADVNRAKFGRTKQEKNKVAAEEAKTAKRLDQQRLPKGDAI